MQFGGGQGANIGVGNYGMRFGNGQGTRIGGPIYGMQFGGQQGTQIGRFSTTPNVVPGTYYYNDVRSLNNSARVANSPRVVRQVRTPVVRQVQTPVLVRRVQTPVAGQSRLVYSQPTRVTYVQPLPGQPIATPSYPSIQIASNSQPINSQAFSSTIMPTSALPAADGSIVENSLPGAESIPTTLNDESATPTLASADGFDAPEVDMAAEESPTETTTLTPGSIRLSHSATATEDIKFNLSGTDQILAPGKSMSLDTGYDWKILFSAGEDFGDREATLTQAGEYEFTKSEDEGWVLMEMEPVDQTADETEAESDETFSLMKNETPTAEANGADEKLEAPTVEAPETETPADSKLELSPSLELDAKDADSQLELSPTLEEPNAQDAGSAETVDESVSILDVPTEGDDK